MELALNETDNTRDRKICFIDSNKDLYITNVYTIKLVKVMNMCHSFFWNNMNDMLCCVADEKFYVRFRLILSSILLLLEHNFILLINNFYLGLDIS